MSMIFFLFFLIVLHLKCLFSEVKREGSRQACTIHCCAHVQMSTCGMLVVC